MENEAKQDQEGINKYCNVIINCLDKINQLYNNKETAISAYFETTISKDSKIQDLEKRLSELIKKYNDEITQLKVEYEDKIRNSGLMLEKQKTFLKEQEDVLDDFIKRFKSIILVLKDIVLTKVFQNSSFCKKIEFQEGSFTKLILSIEFEAKKSSGFFEKIEFDFSKKLYSDVVSNKDLLSKIIQLYAYCNVDHIRKDIESLIDIRMYCENVKSLLDLFAEYNIHLIYPILFKETYIDELHEIEEINTLNQINSDYLKKATYNQLIDISDIGILYKGNKTKPKVSRSNR